VVDDTGAVRSLLQADSWVLRSRARLGHKMLMVHRPCKNAVEAALGGLK
jgi:hypothetical protein